MRGRWGVVLLTLFVTSAILATYLVAREFGKIELTLPSGRACVVNTAGTPSSGLPLDSTQLANAATIAAVGLRRGLPHRAIVVAFATAWQESKLENLAGGDRDSIGLFQQRPSQGWGRPEQIADPRYAANAFYTSLLKVKGWQQMRVTDAAQAVQRSAYPEAYEKWTDESEIMAKALAGDATSAVACSISGEPGTRGPDAAQRLTASLRLDWGDVRTVEAQELTGVALSARNAKIGWQYAHWLVAHAQEKSVQRVRYDGQEWTARTGGWAAIPDAAPDAARVLAEVYPL